MMSVAINHFSLYSKFIAGISVCFLLLLSSCGEKNKKSVPEGMSEINLKSYGKPFSIFVPDTTKSPLSITEQSTGALEIRSGKSFGLVIQEQFVDLSQIRADVKEDEVNKLQNILTDESDAFVWESAITQPEFHFYLNKKIKNSEYSFEDLKDTESEPFRKEAVLRMFELCKSIETE
jgi:hypothetical protein